MNKTPLFLWQYVNMNTQQVWSYTLTLVGLTFTFVGLVWTWIVPHLPSDMAAVKWDKRNSAAYRVVKNCLGIFGPTVSIVGILIHPTLSKEGFGIGTAIGAAIFVIVVGGLALDWILLSTGFRQKRAASKVSKKS